MSTSVLHSALTSLRWCPWSNGSRNATQSGRPHALQEFPPRPRTLRRASNARLSRRGAPECFKATVLSFSLHAGVLPSAQEVTAMRKPQTCANILHSPPCTDPRPPGRPTAPARPPCRELLPRPTRLPPPARISRPLQVRPLPVSPHRYPWPRSSNSTTDQSANLYLLSSGERGSEEKPTCTHF